jgi:hypothetical protein
LEIGFLLNESQQKISAQMRSSQKKVLQHFGANSTCPFVALFFAHQFMLSQQLLFFSMMKSM